MFSRICILGGGLLGGSLALALAKLPTPPRVRTWFRRGEIVPEALELGIPYPTSDLADAVVHADLVVLAVPVGVMPGLVRSALASGLPDTCLITDVGSVKACPHQSLAPILRPHSMHFIGSHPMAGSERKGLKAADAELFANAACLLTNDGAAPESMVVALEAFWQKVGCRTQWMSSEEHDSLVARISHLPHLVAAATARTSLVDPSLGVFGGGGLRDTTRVAAGDPAMWAEISIENRNAILPPLRNLIEDLCRIADLLESNRHSECLEWLVQAKHLRDQVP